MTIRSTLAISILAAGASLASAPASAWYGCPGGYELDVRSNGNHARCLRPASTRRNAISRNCPQVQTPLGPVGAGFQRDYYRDGRDACVTQDPSGTAKTAVPHNFCPNGGRHTPVRRRNDVCTVRTSQDERPVSRNVN